MLKCSETDFFSILVFRHTLKKPILADFSMFQLYALFLIYKCPVIEGIHSSEVVDL